MHIVNIVLCTADSGYARSFAETAELFSGGTMKIRRCASKEKLEELLYGKRRPDMILVEPQMYGELFRKGVDIAYERICILSDGADPEGEAAARRAYPEIKRFPQIQKYRDIGSVMEEIRQKIEGWDVRDAQTARNVSVRSVRKDTGKSGSAAGDGGTDSAKNTLEKERRHTDGSRKDGHRPIVRTAQRNGEKAEDGARECSLIGFYSPIRRTGQTAYAKRLAGKAGENVPVLYISLDPYAGSYGDKRDTLADLLYYMQQEDVVFQRMLRKIVWQGKQFHQVLPVRLPLDLWSISAKQWTELFLALREKSIYKNVYIDFADGVQGLFGLLELCDTIYTPIERDGAALNKLTQYEQALIAAGRRPVLDKTRRVYLGSYGERAELDGTAARQSGRRDGSDAGDGR